VGYGGVEAASRDADIEKLAGFPDGIDPAGGQRQGLVQAVGERERRAGGEGLGQRVAVVCHRPLLHEPAVLSHGPPTDPSPRPRLRSRAPGVSARFTRERQG
jgi:hypothetical protein